MILIPILITACSDTQPPAETETETQAGAESAQVEQAPSAEAEAAAELDLPLGTVKSRVRLAIQKLQGLMEA